MGVNPPNSDDSRQVGPALEAAMRAVAELQRHADAGRVPPRQVIAQAHSDLGMLLAFVTRSSR